MSCPRSLPRGKKQPDSLSRSPAISRVLLGQRPGPAHPSSRSPLQAVAVRVARCSFCFHLPLLTLIDSGLTWPTCWGTWVVPQFWDRTKDRPLPEATPGLSELGWGMWAVAEVTPCALARVHLPPDLQGTSGFLIQTHVAHFCSLIRAKEFRVWVQDHSAGIQISAPHFSVWEGAWPLESRRRCWLCALPLVALLPNSSCTSRAHLLWARYC